MWELWLCFLRAGEDQDLCGMPVNERGVLVAWVSMWNICNCLVGGL